MKLTKLGVWAAIDGLSAVEAAAFVRRIDTWGYGALWIPDGGRGCFNSRAGVTPHKIR